MSSQMRTILGTIGVVALLIGFALSLTAAGSVSLFFLITGTVLSTVSLHTGNQVYLTPRRARGKSFRWW
jgi:hypothetical protein